MRWEAVGEEDASMQPCPLSDALVSIMRVCEEGEVTLNTMRWSHASAICGTGMVARGRSGPPSGGSRRSLPCTHQCQQ
jgi:hypothetical protein